MPCRSRNALIGASTSAGRALVDRAGAGDKSLSSEAVGIDEAVIGFVGLAEHRKSRCAGFPIEEAGIDDRAAHRDAVTAHELCQRMHDDVGAIHDRPQQDRRRHGVVDDQRDAMRMGDARERLDVADVAGGSAHGFAEDRARGLVDQRRDVFGAVARGEARFDAVAPERVGEQRMRRAVELRRRDDASAAIGESQKGVVERRLTGGHSKRGDAALE